MARERICFELTKTYTGMYSVEIPDELEDVWGEERRKVLNAILAREFARWDLDDPDADAGDALLDHAGSYGESFDGLEMGWE